MSETEQPTEADQPAWGRRPALGYTAAFGLATLCGMLTTAGYPGYDLWPFAFIAFAPLIVAMHGQSTRITTWLGWMAGFSMTMFGFYWLGDTVVTFTGMPGVVGFMVGALLCAYQAGRIALCGFLYGRAASRGWPAAPVFVAAFAASELLYPLLFPWYHGASVIRFPSLMGVADIGGVILVGVVLLAPTLAVAELIERIWFKLAPSRVVLVLGAAVPLLAAAYGRWRIDHWEAIAAASDELTVALVQANQPLKDKSAALEEHRRLSADLKQRGVDLAIWSETALRGMMEQDHEAIVRNDIAAGLGIGLIVGTVLRRPLPEGSARALTRFNTALLIDEQGSVRGRYDKQLLLPFGEMLPLGDTFPVLHELSPNTGTFSPGTSQQALLLGAHRLSVSICYEDIMPGLFNDMVRASDPHLLVNLTNDGWFGNTAEPWIHLTLARVRSIEHRRYLARATSTGYSAIVDPFGRLVAHGTTFEQEVIVGKVRMLEGSTPYRWLGNKPWWLLTALLVAAGFVRHPSTPGRSKLAGAE